MHEDPFNNFWFFHVFYMCQLFIYNDFNIVPTTFLPKEKCCNEITNQSLCMDSEQDDTEYILMQIQKSKESITVRKPRTCVVKFF